MQQATSIIMSLEVSHALSNLRMTHTLWVSHKSQLLQHCTLSVQHCDDVPSIQYTNTMTSYYCTEPLQYYQVTWQKLTINCTSWTNDTGTMWQHCQHHPALVQQFH